MGITGSWHDQYKGRRTLPIHIRFPCLTGRAIDSAYIFVGGLHYDLTEGDVITIFSQSVATSFRRQRIS